MEISVYAVYPDTCGRSYPYIFVYADVTVSEPVFFRARFSKMAASRNVVCSKLLGLLLSLIACLELNVAMLNLNFNYLRCPDTNRIRGDGRIRFVYAKCGRRYFCIRIKKFADTKISGYLWTGPDSDITL